MNGHPRTSRIRRVRLPYANTMRPSTAFWLCVIVMLTTVVFMQHTMLNSRQAPMVCVLDASSAGVVACK